MKLCGTPWENGCSKSVMLLAALRCQCPETCSSLSTLHQIPGPSQSFSITSELQLEASPDFSNHWLLLGADHDSVEFDAPD